MYTAVTRKMTFPWIEKAGCIPSHFLVWPLLEFVRGINHFVGMPREHPSTASRVQTFITTECYWQDFMHEVCHGDDFSF